MKMCLKLLALLCVASSTLLSDSFADTGADYTDSYDRAGVTTDISGDEFYASYSSSGVGK